MQAKDAERDVERKAEASFDAVLQASLPHASELLQCLQGYYKDAKHEVKHEAEAAKSWIGGQKEEAKLAVNGVSAQKVLRT